MLYRARHKQEKVIPKQRGRKAAKTLAEYKYENKRLKTENALLRFFVIKRKEVRSKLKYQIMYRYRAEYPVTVMCRFFGISRSSYYDFVHRAGRPEKDKKLADLIAWQRKRCWGTTYGYRRMWMWIKKKNISKPSFVS